MRNVTYVGLCWAMTLGLVAVALGQQNLQPQQPGAPEAQQYGANQDSNIGEQRAMPAPDASQDRSLLFGASQAAQPEINGGQRRGELGVWMAESNGPGVQILRITPGSAAEKAGLHVGDFVLQVNGRGASSPQGAAQMIRQIPIGQSGTLTIWRDGDQQQLQVTMQPAREIARGLSGDASHQVAFGPPDPSANSDLASRTARLEQQISSLTQELASMRQELRSFVRRTPCRRLVSMRK